MNKRMLVIPLLPLLAVLSACQPRPTPIGLLHAVPETNSAWLGQNVLVQAIAVEPVRWVSFRGDPVRGMVLYNSAATDDDNPDTADGLPLILDDDGSLPGKDGVASPTRGDELLVSGTVEFMDGQLVLDDAFVVRLVRRNVDPDQELQAFEARPPETAPEATDYWAQRLGMRCIVPAGSSVQGVFQDNVRKVSGLHLIRPDAPVLARTNAYARRVFRDAHPLDDQAETLFDNGNEYRFLLGDACLKGTANDAAAMLPAARTFAVLRAAVTGVVLSLDGRYAVHVKTTPSFIPGTDPALNHPFQAADREGRLAVVNYNLENLYDFRDDPFDAQDYASGALTNVPLILNNYVPADEATYRERLRGLAEQIVNELHAPDVLMVQEIEDQDIGTLVDGRLVTGTIDQADGEPDVLQELALEIQQLGGPPYRALIDRSGAGERGIACAFFYRTDRLAPVAPGEVPDAGTLVPATPDRRIMQYRPGRANPEAINAWVSSMGVINDRGPQVAIFRAATPPGDAPGQELVLINNHFRSKPTDFADQRRAQAQLNADLAAGFVARNPQALVVVAGDLNIYPRPDEPLPETPADQLGPLYEGGLYNAYDYLLTHAPAAAYSYVFEGQAQMIDHQFLSPALRARLTGAWVPHINSDFKHSQDEAQRGMSDHDPVVTCFQWP